jgi:hypothetical protein
MVKAKWYRDNGPGAMLGEGGWARGGAICGGVPPLGGLSHYFPFTWGPLSILALYLGGYTFHMPTS